MMFKFKEKITSVNALLKTPTFYFISYRADDTVISNRYVISMLIRRKKKSQPVYRLGYLLCIIKGHGT